MVDGDGVVVEASTVGAVVLVVFKGCRANDS